MSWQSNVLHMMLRRYALLILNPLMSLRYLLHPTLQKIELERVICTRITPARVMMTFMLMSVSAFQTQRLWRVLLSRNWADRELSLLRRVLRKLLHGRATRCPVDAGDIDIICLL
ncbi:hypothetical protein CISIN_1g042781mg [Citrus sinensis]|uniref:Uncharacterized protein n=1 Tax=Citrus sinensis TaxID=2711 RepID=A0A067D1Z5_CITSI|nr:hypothetical protein CISIN_1g042781mg [Citrus sinensis]